MESKPALDTGCISYSDHGLASVTRMDDEMKEVFQCLHYAKHQKNATIPLTDRLPPETLAKVFAHLQDEWPAYLPTERLAYGEDGAADRPEHWKLGWLNVTYVCRYFRQVAVAETSLWTHIKLGVPSTVPPSTTWAIKFIQRSKVAPLHLSVVFGRRDRTSVLGTLLTVLQGHSHRIQSISLEEDAGTLLEMAYVVQALRPLPSLRSLDIHWNSNRDDPLPMSAAFSSPSLEHLGITGIMPSPAFPFLARLTSLSVTIIHVPTPNLRHPLEAVLRGTPQLRRFKLEQRFPGIIDVGPGPFILPDSVRDFELSYETPALCDFVDRIVVPASASVWIYPPHTATEPSKLHTLLKKNMLTGPSRLLLDDGTTVLEATSRDGCRERRQIGFGEASTERPRRILAVSLHAVRELCLAPLRCGERDTDLTKGTWGVILSRAPALVHIAVPAVCAMDVVMTLAWTLRMVQGEYSVLARGLEKVTILHGATAEGEEGEEDGDTRLDWESIERAREVRRELGCPFVVEEVSEDRVRPWVESWYDMDG